MFKRLFWLAVGTGLGFGASFWLMRTVRQQVARLAPVKVSGQVTDAVTSRARAVGDGVKAALAEGRRAMREREAELRAEVGRQPGNRSTGR